MDRCNEFAWANQPVYTGFPENVKELEYRSKKELQGDIRIVRAGTADICACCGTHTATTAQAGPIVALNSQAYKGGTRITIACGKRAVEYLKTRNDDCYNVSHQLSVPVENITTAVTSRLDEIGQLKFALANAKRQLMAVWADNAQPVDGVCVMVKDDLQSNEIRSFAALLAQKADTAVVLTPQPNGSGKICIVSTVYDTNKLGRHISVTLGGKGGGKPGTYQGNTDRSADEETIFNIIKSFG
jgi:alanyl-tRNA synthetase